MSIRRVVIVTEPSSNTITGTLSRDRVDQGGLRAARCSAFTRTAASEGAALSPAASATLRQGPG